MVQIPDIRDSLLLGSFSEMFLYSDGYIPSLVVASLGFSLLFSCAEKISFLLRHEVYLVAYTIFVYYISVKSIWLYDISCSVYYSISTKSLHSLLIMTAFLVPFWFVVCLYSILPSTDIIHSFLSQSSQTAKIPISFSSRNTL